MDKILFESKAWEIVDSEGMIFVVNKRFKSEGRYDQDVEVTAETFETVQIKGVKIPNYIREVLAGIFEELAAVAAKEQAVAIAEMEKQIEEELKPFVAPDLVKTFAIKAAINGDRLVRAIKENEPWTDEDSLVSSGVMLRNGYTDATLYLGETYILEYLDKVSGKIYVISDLFYRGHYKDFLLFNKRGSYWVLMADQVKKVVQQDKFLGGAF